MQLSISWDNLEQIDRLKTLTRRLGIWDHMGAFSTHASDCDIYIYDKKHARVIPDVI